MRVLRETRDSRAGTCGTSQTGPEMVVDGSSPTGDHQLHCRRRTASRCQTVTLCVHGYRVSTAVKSALRCFRLRWVAAAVRLRRLGCSQGPASQLCRLVSRDDGGAKTRARRCVLRCGHTVHGESSWRLRTATPETEALSLGAAAAVGEVQAEALSGERAGGAEAIRAVRVVNTRLTASAIAAAAAETMRARRLPHVRVEQVANGRRAPRATVGERITDHGAYLRAGAIRRAELVCLTAAIRVAFAFGAEATSATRAQLQDSIPTTKRPSVSDLLGVDAVRIGGVAGQAASVRAGGKRSERVDVAVVARGAFGVRIAAQLGAVAVEIALATAQATKA